MTRSQVLADPLAGAAAPVLAGSAVAVGLAGLASGLFPVGFVNHVEPHPGLRFDPVVHLGGGAVFAVLLVAWVAVSLRAADHQPRRASGPSWVERIAGRLRPAQVSTAFRFAFTRPGDGTSGQRVAVVGMVAIFGLLVGALTFGASLGGFVDAPGRWGQNFDVSVGAGGGGLSDEVRSAIEADPNVTGLTLFGTVLTSVGTDSFDVTGLLPVVGSVTPVMLAGRLPQGEDEIAIGRVAADRFDVGVGDELVVTGAAGPVTLRVIGLAVVPGVEGGDGIGEGGLVTFPALQRIDPLAQLTAAGIRLRPDTPREAVAALAERTGMGIGRFDQPPAIINLTRVETIPYVIAAVLAALALLSLAHQLVLSAERRRRDVAVLQALGADRAWVTGLVHWQATLFTAVVMALALPAGIIAGLIVFRSFVGRLGALDTVSVPLLTLGLSLVVLGVLVEVVAAVNARRARRRRAAWTLTAE